MQSCLSPSLKGKNAEGVMMKSNTVWVYLWGPELLWSCSGDSGDGPQCWNTAQKT